MPRIRRKNIKRENNISVTANNIDFLRSLAYGEENAQNKLQDMIDEYDKRHKRICLNCGCVFQSSFSQRYCETCRQPENAEKIRWKQRKESVRYLHKRVYDMIGNSKRFDDETRKLFLEESNYYWSKVIGKIPKTEGKESYRDIKTENQYRKWLENTIEEIHSMSKTSNKSYMNVGRTGRKIKQLDKDGNLVAEWESALQASRELGIFQSNITSCCRGNIGTYKGYIWEYAEESEVV